MFGTPTLLLLTFGETGFIYAIIIKNLLFLVRKYHVYQLRYLLWVGLTFFQNDVHELTQNIKLR